MQAQRRVMFRRPWLPAQNMAGRTVTILTHRKQRASQLCGQVAAAAAAQEPLTMAPAACAPSRTAAPPGARQDCHHHAAISPAQDTQPVLDVRPAQWPRPRVPRRQLVAPASGCFRCARTAPAATPTPPLPVLPTCGGTDLRQTTHSRSWLPAAASSAERSAATQQLIPDVEHALSRQRMNLSTKYQTIYPQTHISR